VKDRDIDLLGHVNNLVWVRWTVQLAEAHAKALGMGFDDTRALGGVWVVIHQDLHYHRGALPGQELRETTWVSLMRGARSRRHSRFRDEAGALLFEATTEWAFVDPESMRARRVPPAIAERFDCLDSPESLEAAD
jgi:acyl-CoA thioester hydrolase